MSSPLPAPERGLPLFALQTEGDIAVFQLFIYGAQLH